MIFYRFLPMTCHWFARIIVKSLLQYKSWYPNFQGLDFLGTLEISWKGKTMAKRTPVDSSQNAMIILICFRHLLALLHISAHFCIFRRCTVQNLFENWLWKSTILWLRTKICFYGGGIARTCPLRCTISSLGSWQFLCRIFGTFGCKILWYVW